ncbi:MAG: hypothetical protein K5888_09760 [Lachnospiraceae bacterium]|nr:hypothetical protein [Lachnospiraceae bacterium]
MNKAKKYFGLQFYKDFFKGMFKLPEIKNIDRYLAVFVMLMSAILVELFVFNYKHWTSLFNKPFAMSPTAVYGMTDIGDGRYKTEPGDKALEFSHISQKIKTAYVNILVEDDLESEFGSILRVDFNGMDDSHKQYYGMSHRVIASDVPRSKYVTFHFYGDTEALAMAVYPGDNRTISVEVVFNPVIPLFFRWERVVLVFAFALLVFFFRPSSFLHKIKYSGLDLRFKLIMLVVYFAANALILKWVNGVNPMYQGEGGVNTMQYQELAEAFSAGQLSILDEPCDKLKNMENPYDMSARAEIMEFGEWYFDHAYYNGKYYVYFGVVPAVIVYWPYYLITGHHIHNYTVCYIGVLLILLGFILLYDEIIMRFAKKTSVAMWFLLTELTLLGSYVVYVTKRPDLYSVPIIYAVAFSLLGMWAYTKALPSDPKKKILRLNKVFLVLGSVFTALVAGCRPQVFLVVILGVLILRCFAFDFAYLRTKDGILAIVCVFVPMLVIGGLLMAYNALRFGSPFDFGAFYNLTFNDMRNRGFVWDRIPLGFSVYLFHPVNFVPEYPYFGNVWMDTQYMGETIQETTYGGIFMSSPFSLLALIPFFYASKLKKRATMWLISIASVVIALMIMVFDTINSGLLARYFFDFSFLWMIAAGIAVLNVISIQKIKKTGVYNALTWTLIVFVIFEVIYQCLVFMLDSGDYLQGYRRDLFYHLYYLFGFGM